MYGPCPIQLVVEGRDEGGRQGCDAFFVALAGTNRDLFIAEVDVLDAQAEGFRDAEATAIEQVDNQLRDPPDDRQEPGNFIASEDDRDVGIPVGPKSVDTFRERKGEHLLIQKYQRVHGLVLSGGCDVRIDGQMGQEGFDL